MVAAAVKNAALVALERHVECGPGAYERARVVAGYAELHAGYQPKLAVEVVLDGWRNAIDGAVVVSALHGPPTAARLMSAAQPGASLTISGDIRSQHPMRIQAVFGSDAEV